MLCIQLLFILILFHVIPTDEINTFLKELNRKLNTFPLSNYSNRSYTQSLVYVFRVIYDNNHIAYSIIYVHPSYIPT